MDNEGSCTVFDTSPDGEQRSLWLLVRSKKCYIERKLFLYYAKISIQLIISEGFFVFSLPCV